MSNLFDSQSCDKSTQQERVYQHIEQRQVQESPTLITDHPGQRKSQRSTPTSNKKVYQVMEVNAKEPIEQYKPRENHNE